MATLIRYKGKLYAEVKSAPRKSFADAWLERVPDNPQELDLKKYEREAMRELDSIDFNEVLRRVKKEEPEIFNLDYSLNQLSDDEKKNRQKMENALTEILHNDIWESISHNNLYIENQLDSALNNPLYYLPQEAKDRIARKTEMLEDKIINDPKWKDVARQAVKDYINKKNFTFTDSDSPIRIRKFMVKSIRKRYL